MSGSAKKLMRYGATTGALDESLLFYLRARGLSEKEAADVDGGIGSRVNR